MIKYAHMFIQTIRLKYVRSWQGIYAGVASIPSKMPRLPANCPRLKKWVLDIYFLGNALGFFWTIGITWKNDKSWLQGGCHRFQHARPHLHPVPRYWPSWLRWFSLCRCPLNLWTMWSSLVGRWQSRLRRCRTWVTAVLQSGWLCIVTYRLIWQTYFPTDNQSSKGIHFRTSCCHQKKGETKRFLRLPPQLLLVRVCVCVMGHHSR